MQISIASGKGGTGKTTIATNLAYFLKKQNKTVTLLDCDVEEPNCHLFLHPTWTSTEKSTSKIPLVNMSKCIKCGRCGDICHFGAIANIKDTVLVFPELCHGCGGCSIVCPTGAITESEKEIGDVQTGTADGLEIVQGLLKVGEPMSPPLIRSVKKYANTDDEFVIVDCPPGTSCPVIESLKNSDFILLITEPTPFGLNDLKLAVDVVNELKIPFAVGINRSTIGDSTVWDYCKEQNIPIILEIPHDRHIARAYSEGILLLKALPQYEEKFTGILEHLQEVLPS